MEEQLIESYSSEGETISEQFSVNSDDSANWVIRQIIEARAYGERCDAWAERERARARQREQFFWWRYGDQLRAWIGKMISEQGGRRKSVCLPAGTAGYRHQADKLVIEDEKAVIEWARTHRPEIICMVERLDKTAFNDSVWKNGEIPDCGVRVEPAEEHFYVR